MKEYKFKINGNEYNVAVKKVEGKIAEVNVNGVDYSVEMENAPQRRLWRLLLQPLRPLWPHRLRHRRLPPPRRSLQPPPRMSPALSRA